MIQSPLGDPAPHGQDRITQLGPVALPVEEHPGGPSHGAGGASLDPKPPLGQLSAGGSRGRERKWLRFLR